MRSLFLHLALITTLSLNAQTNTSNVPNTGANTTPPPMQTYTTPADNLANPSNSTVPGASGSYSVQEGKPQFQNPGTNGAYTTYPSAPQPATTYSPQKTNATEKKKTGK
jgi:hypothetical protein